MDTTHGAVIHQCINESALGSQSVIGLMDGEDILVSMAQPALSDVALLGSNRLPCLSFDTASHCSLSLSPGLSHFFWGLGHARRTHTQRDNLIETEI
jgi:hypothetical protein